MKNLKGTSKVTAISEDYAVWRQQHSTSIPAQWILTSHRLKARNNVDAQTKLKRMFAGAGFSAMSLIAMPAGTSPNVSYMETKAS